MNILQFEYPFLMKLKSEDRSTKCRDSNQRHRDGRSNFGKTEGVF